MSFRGELSVVDLTTGSVTDLDDVELDELSFVLAVTPDGRRVYIVCNPRPRVTVVDLGGL